MIGLRRAAAARKLTLRTKLIISMGGVSVLVAALLLMAHQVLRDAASWLEASRTNQVRPLVQINGLQSKINRIRLLEVELPRLADLFAVTDQVELIDTERADFNLALAKFTGEIRELSPLEAAGLQEQWRRYHADLERAMALARRMDLEAAQRIATFESAARFKSIQLTLGQVAQGTARRSDEAFSRALDLQARQRALFVVISAVGLAVLAFGAGALARSVSNRISRLRDAATRLAEGSAELPIVVSGSDEIADLGAVFNAMHAKVVAREGALRLAHSELEERVASRTCELNEANAQLLREIEERRCAEQRLTHQAQYDHLTDLPNRLLAMDRLSQALLAAQRGSHHAVLVFLDLDDFKKVNDTLGHDVGDMLLIQATHRLRSAVRAEDTVARHGGDEFLVILGGLKAPEDAEAVTEKILRAFVPSFDVGGHEVVVTPSMGLAVYPDDGDDAGTLLRNADMAMYVAKEEGRNTYRYFNQQVHDSSVRRLAIERRLRGAAERGEFELVYQPLVSAVGGRLAGAEALLRWHWPEHGCVPPEQFISVAEHTGLIVEIGAWVLNTACAQLRRWREAGWGECVMSVNVSPRQFRGETLLATVKECLSLHGVPPSALQFEVTEGLLVRNSPEVRETLFALSALGVKLAMDDFGTGYSSLSYLKHFPFNALKIDRGFVRDVGSDSDDRALVSAAIRMGKGLGLSVVAEGVETEEQLAFLAEQGCDLVQGYLMDAPLPAEHFARRWLLEGPHALRAA